MKFKFIFLFAAGLFLYAGTAYAAPPKEEVETSTVPIGSSFYRHLAYDFNWDIAKLARYEKRGFGRAEIITLMLLSRASGVPLKDLGNRRLERESTLEEMTKEAGLDYVTLYKIVQVIKEDIEAKGDDRLPPPVYSYEIKKEESPAPAVHKQKKELE